MRASPGRAIPTHRLPSLLLAFLLGLAPLPATAGPAEDIAAGDEAYGRRDATRAREQYLAALAADPQSLGALWRLARVESELGEETKGQPGKELLVSAVAHGRQAVKIAPDSALSHTWLAVALGRQALREGPKTKLALSKELKAEVDRAIQLDPASGRAYHLRAAWNRGVAELSAIERMTANTVLGGVPKGASYDNAVSDFQKAIELEPDYVNHRLELGRTLMAMKRWPDARTQLEKAVSLPPTSSPRDPRYQAEARELLKKIEKK